MKRHFMRAVIHSNLVRRLAVLVTVCCVTAMLLSLIPFTKPVEITYADSAARSPVKNWAVIVGISNYLYLNDLYYCDDDAADIYNRLTGSGWQPANISLLTNSQATKANIQSSLDWMRNSAGSQDLCLFYFSGHGDQGDSDLAPVDETDSLDEYICPYNSLLYSWDNDIRDDELDAWMSQITARKVVVIDSCNSGGFIKSKFGNATGKFSAAATYVEVAPELVDGFARDVNKTGFITLTACDDDETSREYPALQNGVFTYYFDQGLSGSADLNSNGVSAEEAFAYTSPMVQSYTYGSQNPQLWDGIDSEVILTPYTLTVNSTAGGSVTEPGQGIFTCDPGSVVDLLAVPDSGYKFVNWTGYVGTVADSYAADTTITMNSSYVITANFTLSTLPTVITTTATSVTSNSATLNGTLYNLGSATSVQVSFEWGNTTNYGNETPEQTKSMSTVFSADISGLIPGTTYHFRAKAVGDSTAYGTDMTFTTEATPSVMTNAAGNITTDSAILNGNLTAMGTATSVTVSFEWGNTTSYGNETPAQVFNAPGAFSGNITGLNPNTTYHFRARAVGDGTSYGNDATFIVTGPVLVTGITRQIKGDVLPGVAITLDGIGPVVSDQDGQFQITDTAIGNYTVTAHKDGFRDRTHVVNIAPGQGSTVTCNFQGQSGLIPNAPDMWYALDCINLWLYPPNPDTGLDIWTALDVVNAWLYPVQ